MKQVVCLSEEEIKELIAQHFCVDKDKVRIDVHKEWRGYGLGEHFEDEISALFEVPVATTAVKG